MPISKREADIISKVTGESIADFTKPLDQTDGVLELANDPKTKACVFLVTDSDELDAPGRCSIHINRPTGCRHYPTVLDMEDEVWLDDICPHKEEFKPPCEEDRRVLLELDARIQAEAENRN